MDRGYSLLHFMKDFRQCKEWPGFQGADENLYHRKGDKTKPQKRRERQVIYKGYFWFMNKGG